ncbi:MAG: hypothetical protein KAT15_27035, partial [Bacteroidales bacterium]|nr:hypothetical protein [Bacteroidales bacterium]
MTRHLTSQYRKDLLRSKSTRETYQTLCDLLDRYKKVYYSRFGDGDMMIIMGKKQNNHDYNIHLAEEIRQSLSIENPLFLRGLQVNHPHDRGMTKGLFERYYYNDEMQDFLLENIKLPWPMVFESAWFPNYFTSFYPLEMNRFLDRYIRPKKKMFIGSVPETEIRKLVGDVHFYISTPRKNAYATIDTWWPEILKYLDSVEVVLPAAGMATRVISKRLWDLDKEVHCIDLGSIVDAVSSFPPSRKWIKLKKHALNRILLPEFRDNSLSYWIRYAVKETGLFIRYQYYKVAPFFSMAIFPTAKRK